MKSTFINHFGLKLISKACEVQYGDKWIDSDRALNLIDGFII